MCYTRLLHGYASDGNPTPEYVAWQAIKQRCLNPKNPQYPQYGGRGIRVSNEWAGDFLRFLADVGFRPSALHSIDRINNNGHYEHGNVRWATKAEQQLNRRVCLRLRRVDSEGNEEPISLAQAAGYLAISYSAFRANLIRAGVLKPEKRFA